MMPAPRTTIFMAPVSDKSACNDSTTHYISTDRKPIGNKTVGTTLF